MAKKKEKVKKQEIKDTTHPLYGIYEVVNNRIKEETKLLENFDQLYQHIKPMLADKKMQKVCSQIRAQLVGLAISEVVLLVSMDACFGAQLMVSGIKSVEDYNRILKAIREGNYEFKA